MPVNGETGQQLALMQWAQYTRVGAYWLREILVHVPNGGKRGRIEAAILKGMGVKPGWPDLQLPVPVRDFHGAYWELKDTDGRLSPAQIECHAMLRAFGYYVGVFHDWAACSMDILRYLAMPGAPAPFFRREMPTELDLVAARRKARHPFKPGPRIVAPRRSITLNKPATVDVGPMVDTVFDHYSARRK